MPTAIKLSSLFIAIQYWPHKITFTVLNINTSVVHVDSHDIRDGVISSAVLVLVGHYKVQYTHDTTNDSHSSVVPECGISWLFGSAAIIS